MSSRAAIVLLFAKAPIGGAVKTRLAREVGMAAATAWYRRSLGRVVDLLKHSRLKHLVVCVPSPARFRAASGLVARMDVQSPGDLGRRMADAARRARGASIVVGSDIPQLTPRILRDAARALTRFDLVLGPARDGGFYLVGLRTPAHAFRLYDCVRWSSAHAMADTLANAPAHWRIAFLPLLSDVDDAAGLQSAAAIRWSGLTTK